MSTYKLNSDPGAPPTLFLPCHHLACNLHLQCGTPDQRLQQIIPTVTASGGGLAAYQVMATAIRVIHQAYLHQHTRHLVRTSYRKRLIVYRLKPRLLFVNHINKLYVGLNLTCWIPCMRFFIIAVRNEREVQLQTAAASILLTTFCCYSRYVGHLLLLQ